MLTWGFSEVVVSTVFSQVADDAVSEVFVAGAGAVGARGAGGRPAAAFRAVVTWEGRAEQGSGYETPHYSI